jgi:U32 family peptidase
VSGPEVLAPAGAPACLEAAVAGGAHAVYFGLRHFNARGRAENFRMADLPAQLDYLHDHGLKAYLTLNTLIHDDEFGKALTLAQAAHIAAVDAVLVQDLGLWRVLRQELPDLPLHASTQMTVHSPEQIRVLAQWGAQRVVLARELSLVEVRACTRAAAELGVETEHFVHGAMCYAYSGQCLMSNFAGCRSANRGTCAQNCRYDYTSEGNTDSLISLKDLAAIQLVAALADAGVASLKIEGRLKGPDYVYTVSRVYRRAVDAWSTGDMMDWNWVRRQLSGVFTRGHSDAALRGDYSNNMRILMGGDARQADCHLQGGSRKQGWVLVSGSRPPQVGEGFQFSQGRFNDGFLVTAVEAAGDGLWRCRARLALRGPGLGRDIPCFRNADQTQAQAADKAMAQVRLAAHRGGGLALQGRFIVHPGEPVRWQLRCRDGRAVEICGPEAAAATRRPLSSEQVQAVLGALGGTPYRLQDLQVDMPEPVFLPLSGLKRLRREAVAALDAQPLPGIAWQAPAVQPVAARPTALWVVVASAVAARAALDSGADGVVLDDPCLDLWRERCPDLQAYADIPASQRLLRHPVTRAVSPHLAGLGWAVLAGQIGVLAAASQAGLPVVVDHFCNVVNSACLAALGDAGADAAVISLECSAREIARLCARAAAMPGLWCVVHGRVMSMLTRQDHGLAPGELQRLQTVERDGGLPYLLQGRLGRQAVIWEARELCSPQHAAATAGLVDAWLLETAHVPPDLLSTLVSDYRALADGADRAAAIERLTDGYALDGRFAGHLDIGSRALDEVRA